MNKDKIKWHLRLPAIPPGTDSDVLVVGITVIVMGILLGAALAYLLVWWLM